MIYEITPEQLCARWANVVKVSTLKTWRYMRKGPAFNKRGHKITYSITAIEAYERENRIIPEK